MKTRIWSIVAFVLSLLICVVVVFTSFTDDATWLSRLHTTIIQWNLPLVAMGVIIYSFISERDETTPNVMAWVSVCLILVAMLCTNLTKNIAQDVCSNIENYVDMTTSVIDEESGNVKEYADRLNRSIEAAEDRIRETVHEKKDTIRYQRKDTKRYRDSAYYRRY